jgi:YVTN family beta-propeller protein
MLALGLAGALAAGGAMSAAGPAAADSVPTPVTTIAVGNTPTGIALTPTTAYVANAFSSSLSEINLATNTVTSTIALGAGPQGVAVTPNGSQVFTANPGSNTVSAITTATGAVTSIPVDTYPFDLAVTPNGQYLYVTNVTADAVDLIDIDSYGDEPDTSEVFDTETKGLAVSPNGNLLFVTLPQVNEVAAFNATNFDFINEYAVGSDPDSVAFSPNSNYAYVTNEGSNTVSVLNSSSGALVATVPVGSSPADVAVSPDGAQVYVNNYNSGNLSVISTATNTVTATVAIGSSSQYVAASADGTRVYATNAGGNSVSVLGVTPTPTVTSISPAFGPPAGGNQVTITGTYLTGASVDFGTTAATGVSCSATSCTATAPAGTAGTVNVQVTTPSGTSATSTNDRYTYGVIPAVTGVSPNGGGTGGGYRVTITGTGLSGATSVAFGGATVSSPSCTATTCTVQAPNVSNTGTVNVTVTANGAVSPTSSASQFTYEGAPTITAISPVGGPAAGGNTVTITGTNLAGATLIQFQSGQDATNISCTPTSCTLTAPSGTGNTSTTVTLFTPAGTTTSSATYFFANPATITNVSPSSGPPGGGNTVTVTGTNLGDGYIAFGSNWATSGNCGPTTCTVVVPAGTAGTVRVYAYTMAGFAAYNTASQYTYN